jgi:hypothetical protein
VILISELASVDGGLVTHISVAVPASRSRRTDLLRQEQVERSVVETRSRFPHHVPKWSFARLPRCLSRIRAAPRRTLGRSASGALGRPAGECARPCVWSCSRV